MDEYIRDNLPTILGDPTTRQIRFKWDEGPKSCHNHDMLRIMTDYTVKHAGDLVSGAGPLIGQLTHDQVLIRLTKRYEALRKIWRGTSGKQSTKPGSGLTKAMRDNRAKGVCTSSLESVELNQMIAN